MIALNNFTKAQKVTQNTIRKKIFRFLIKNFCFKTNYALSLLKFYFIIHLIKKPFEIFIV